jgi:glutamyl-tRNA synthetase/glutamyl-Q tRNA(Asp) synthetase
VISSIPVPSPIITRFAPAPTGFLHLGHVVNAIYVWGVTRAMGGRVLLRIEDHDRQRSRAEFEQPMLDDLAWLGFAADEASTRQSERYEIYESALERLRRQGLVYACECSRAEIAVAAESGVERRYPGTCATKRLAEGRGRGTRVRLDRLVVRFADRRHGMQEQVPSEQCGDLLVRDRDGNWTYQFAVTVDDFEQGVSLVIRGDDLLSSTGRQIQLASLLGRHDPPQFLHHPLVMKSPTQKVSKSDGDSGIGELRAKGWTAPQVIGHAAFLAGLIAEARAVEASQVSSLFDTRARYNLRPW